MAQSGDEKTARRRGALRGNLLQNYLVGNTFPNQAQAVREFAAAFLKKRTSKIEKSESRNPF